MQQVPNVRLVAGLDVGQRIDPSALCLAEIVPRAGADPRFVVRRIERLALGTEYLAVAGRAVELLRNTAQRLRRGRYDDEGRLLTDGWDFQVSAALLMDATGCGGPVAEMIRRVVLAESECERWQYRLTVEPTIFTSGARMTWGDGYRRVAKAYMVSRLQSLFHADRIAIAPSAEVTAMVEELLAYRVKVSDDGHDSYNAKVGHHDDMVVALGLATLLDQSAAGAGSMDYLALERVI